MRDREEYYVLIHPEDTGNLIVYVPNKRAAKYLRQKLIELIREIDKFTVTAGDINTSLSIEQEDSKSEVTQKNSTPSMNRI